MANRLAVSISSGFDAWKKNVHSVAPAELAALDRAAQAHD